MQIHAACQQRLDQLEELLREQESHNKSLTSTIETMNEDLLKYKSKYNIQSMSDLERALQARDDEM